VEVVMALRDDERRKLAEIERELAQADPRLAHRLAELRPLTRGSATALVAGALAMLASGLIMMVVGVQLASPVLVVIGALLSAGFPALAGWHLWWRRRW
jgi:hypothetical protein